LCYLTPLILYLNKALYIIYLSCKEEGRKRAKREKMRGKKKKQARIYSARNIKREDENCKL